MSTRDRLCALLQAVLRPLGLSVRTSRDYDALVRERDAYRELLLCRRGIQPAPEESRIACIVFSKDRALQLHGLLASMQEQVSPPPTTHVLYDCSSTAHAAAYHELAELFPRIRFLRQRNRTSFRDDLLRLLDELSEERLFFLVDDLLFTEPVDLRPLAALDSDRFVPSLRLGCNLTRCYTLQADQPLPPAAKPDPDLDDAFFCWRWSKGVHDWGYPLSVDGHIFDRREITILTHHARFTAPNSFEDGLQLFRPLFQGRLGVCYRKSRLLNIPCNKVQVENDNLAGDIHPDHLLERWQAGFRVDYRRYYGFANISAHQEVPLYLHTPHPAAPSAAKG